MTAAEMRDMGEHPALSEFAAMSPFARALLRLETIARQARDAGIDISAASVDVDRGHARTVINVRTCDIADRLAAVALHDPTRCDNTTFHGSRIVEHREHGANADVEIVGVDVRGVA